MTKQQQQQQHRIPKDLLKVNNTKSNNMMLKWEKGAIKGKGGIIRWSTEDVEGSLSLSRTAVLYLVSQSCPTLCDPVDCSPPGFSVYGILQVRILEWVAMPFSRRSS